MHWSPSSPRDLETLESHGFFMRFRTFRDSCLLKQTELRTDFQQSLIYRLLKSFVFCILHLCFCEYFVTRSQPQGTKDYRSGVIHHVVLHQFFFFFQTCFALEAGHLACLHRCAGTF